MRRINVSVMEVLTKTQCHATIVATIVSMTTDAPIGHVDYEDSFFVGAGNSKMPKKSFGIIHSVLVSVPVLYPVFRYLKVSPVVYRNTEIPNFIRYSQLWGRVELGQGRDPDRPLFGFGSAQSTSSGSPGALKLYHS